MGKPFGELGGVAREELPPASPSHVNHIGPTQGRIRHKPLHQVPSNVASRRVGSQAASPAKTL